MKFKISQVGWQTILVWALIIGIGIILFVITKKSGGLGESTIAKIKDLLPFV